MALRSTRFHAAVSYTVVLYTKGVIGLEVLGVTGTAAKALQNRTSLGGEIQWAGMNELQAAVGCI